MATGTLSAAFVKSVAEGRAEPGKYFDSGGLILRVRPSGVGTWIFRYRQAGRRRDMGLGAPPEVTLAMARELAAQHRRTLALGGEPLDDRQASRAKSARELTFDEAADQYITQHEAGWKNDKHRAQWRSTIRVHVSPKIGATKVSNVDTAAVLSVLRPIWSKLPETASRVRGRIESILDWARVQRMREGENPARWRGNLALVFPSKSKLRRVKHHAAVPLADLPGVFEELGESEGIAAAAVQFAILTAARPGEVAGLQWPEIDAAAKLWTVPGERMKRGREHRVPLNDGALKIIERMEKLRTDESPYVFRSAKKGRPLSLASLAKALRVAGGGDGTTHGTARSCFDDWATARGVPTPVIDRALAHASGDMTVQAYRRADLLDQRRPVMSDWDAFLYTRISTEKTGRASRRKKTPTQL